MLRFLPMYALLILPLGLWGQIERIYGDDGLLRAINPLNEAGEYHGTGYQYYPGGALEKEIPYVKGDIQGELRQYYEDGSLASLTPYQANQRHGLEKEFFPDSTVKATRYWQKGRLEGWTQAFFPSGQLYLYAYLQQDSVLFTQRFNEDRHLTYELVGSWEQPLDTLHLLPAQYSLATGADSLEAGQPTSLQVVVPGVPLSLVRYAARGATLERELGDPLPWFLTLTPEPGAQEVSVFLRISLRPGASATILQSIKIPVSSLKE